MSDHCCVNRIFFLLICVCQHKQTEKTTCLCTWDVHTTTDSRNILPDFSVFLSSTSVESFDLLFVLGVLRSAVLNFRALF